MADNFECRQKELFDSKQKLRYVPGASGVIVAVGGRIVSMDLLDKTTTCEQVWERLLSGASLDALQWSGDTSRPNPATFMDKLRTATWGETKAVGEGEEYRAETKDDLQVSALCFDGQLIHASACTG